MIRNLNSVLSKLAEDYQIVRELGQGGSSYVYLVSAHSNRQLYAAKLYIDAQNGLHEAWILQSIHHPMSPTYIQTVEVEDTICLIMDYVEGTSLKEFCETEQLSTEQILLWFKQICYFFRYLHNLPNPICYLDLKPDNLIVMENKNLKLIDYDAACFLKEDVLRYGTKGYAPKEMFDNKKNIGFFSDVYTVGRLLDFLLKKRQHKYLYRPMEFKQICVLWLLKFLCQNDFFRKKLASEDFLIKLCNLAKSSS